ncbi:MAG: 2-succinyl-5-enolpyruvyl-6-hydroxy-3-cyclohexene-1-carboxylic-acid synthase, partial [Bacteroidetes bacterium]|nr:2-succinyl-5-enolpyruvyl-6-hydroxy-3-cyclohexene-1-carboxylic-acid synthase [Bacteroidota bacterium]
TIKFIPAESNLFVSNSIPVRDLDFFSSKISKKISVFSNRGASGIDGIISTANGIAINSKLPTVLITGDLSFYYDIGSLLYTRNLEIPLVIVLINNNGGAIFNMLPVANEKIDFNKYFTTPHNLEFKNIVRAFGGNFISVKGWKHFESEFHSAIEKISYSVLEIKTDPIKSLDERKNFWKLFEKEINR